MTPLGQHFPTCPWNFVLLPAISSSGSRLCSPWVQTGFVFLNRASPLAFLDLPPGLPFTILDINGHLRESFSWKGLSLRFGEPSAAEAVQPRNCKDQDPSFSLPKATGVEVPSRYTVSFLIFTYSKMVLCFRYPSHSRFGPHARYEQTSVHVQSKMKEREHIFKHQLVCVYPTPELHMMGDLVAPHRMSIFRNKRE